jgi:hypothetical protein
MMFSKITTMIVDPKPSTFNPKIPGAGHFRSTAVYKKI